MEYVLNLQPFSIRRIFGRPPESPKQSDEITRKDYMLQHDAVARYLAAGSSVLAGTYIAFFLNRL